MAKRKDTSCCQAMSDLLEPRFFKALSDPNRITLLTQLAQCCTPCTVTQIAECCPINISVVSRHLALLRDAGILEAQKQGKEVYYSVRYSVLADTLRAIADAVDACCPAKGANSRRKRQ